MGLKTQVVISIIVWAVLNEEISIMIKIKPRICLTMWTGLNHSKTQLLMIAKEIIDKLSDRLKGYLLSRERTIADDGQITVMTSGRPQDRSRHRLATFNLHSGATSREKRLRVDEPICHLALSARRFTRGQRMYSSTWGFQLQQC